MKTWELREAHWCIDHRIMTRRGWHAYRHQVRLEQRNCRLVMEHIGEAMRRTTEQIAEACRAITMKAAALAPAIERLVAAFENDETFQRWRLVNTLTEIEEMKRHD